MEIIFKIIGQFVGEFIFGTLIKGFIRLIYFLGIFTIKIVTFSKDNLKNLKEKYKDRAYPYLIGFAEIIAIGFVLIEIL